MPCLKPSLEQDGNLGPTPLGLETDLLVSRALRWPVEDRKDAGIPEIEGSGAAPGS
jgi:hypothetical protein